MHTSRCDEFFGHGPRKLSMCKGLTLVEMLVVVGICGMLAVLLVPMLLRSRGEARRVVCASNLNTLGQAYAVCLMESDNYLPDAYYGFEGSEGSYEVVLRSPDTDQPDQLFRSGCSSALVCPSDSSPVQVLGRTGTGTAVPVSASYAYNVSLPLMFRNLSRVRRPVNTVSFYDGDAGEVVGTWVHELGWAGQTIRYRHRGAANYLFLDGHVEMSDGFPDRAFEGGSQWVASSRGTTGTGGSGEWDGVDFDIVDGTVVPNETCTATITCLGAAFQNGVGGARIPVQAHYRVNDGSWIEITDDVLGGEQVVLEEIASGDAIALQGKWYLSWRNKGTYASDDGSGHCWAMRDGDVVPSIAGFDGQTSIEDFLEPYMDETGCLTLGPNDVIFLFELSRYTDYERYSCADFQDLVVLVSLSKSTGGGGGGGETVAVGGSININPNNNPSMEFTLTLPDGYEITRDDLHSDNPQHHGGEGFHPDYLEYTGPAVSVRVKPKGNGNQNGLTVDGRPYSLENKNLYVITSDDMRVCLYNDKRNRRGKAMGKWWIDIDANDATIQVVK